MFVAAMNFRKWIEMLGWNLKLILLQVSAEEL